MARIQKRPAAKRDLTLHFAWLAGEAGVELARKFLAAADESFQLLSRMPRIGPVKIYEGKFAGIRMWPITGFEEFLIFYRAAANDVQIERVIHAKRDYQRVLE